MTRDELIRYIKVFCSVAGCNSHDAKQFKCDRYLDCDSCLEDKIKEYDKQVIEQYKTSINLEDTIRYIHYSVAQQMYHKAIDDCLNILKIHKNNLGVIEWAIRDIEKLKEQK